MKQNFETFYPPGQKEFRRYDLYQLATGVFFFVSVLTLAYNVITESGSGFKWLPANTIVDTKTCITIVVSLFSLQLVRHNFVLGLRPIIAYESSFEVSTKLTKLTSMPLVWVVTILSRGAGVAIVRSYDFDIKLSKDNVLHKSKNFFELIQLLKEDGLFEGQDFYLLNITNGYPISKDSSKILFEANRIFFSKVLQLDVHMVFESILRGRHQKSIYLLPKNREQINFPPEKQA
jgi:hypothetical protein